MKLSHLSETLIGSEIVKLGGEIREKIRLGERISTVAVVLQKQHTIKCLKITTK